MITWHTNRWNWVHYLSPLSSWQLRTNILQATVARSHYWADAALDLILFCRFRWHIFTTGNLVCAHAIENGRQQFSLFWCSSFSVGHLVPILELLCQLLSKKRVWGFSQAQYKSLGWSCLPKLAKPFHLQVW